MPNNENFLAEPDQCLDPAARKRCKQESRDADARALITGRKTSEQMREENEVFAALARGARVNLKAARSLY